jgi:hypothetical protein
MYGRLGRKSKQKKTQHTYSPSHHDPQPTPPACYTPSTPVQPTHTPVFPSPSSQFLSSSSPRQQFLLSHLDLTRCNPLPKTYAPASAVSQPALGSLPIMQSHQARVRLPSLDAFKTNQQCTPSPEKALECLWHQQLTKVEQNPHFPRHRLRNLQRRRPRNLNISIKPVAHASKFLQKRQQPPSFQQREYE